MARENIGIYYPEGKEDELEEFDEVAYRHQEGRSYSRSQAVRSSMKMQEMILETVEQVGWDHMDERALRASVRQAILDKARREES